MKSTRGTGGSPWEVPCLYEFRSLVGRQGESSARVCRESVYHMTKVFIALTQPPKMDHRMMTDAKD